MAATPNPVQLKIDHPERLSRLTTVSHGFFAIPAMIMATLVAYGVAFLRLAVLLMLLFRWRYPR